MTINTGDQAAARLRELADTIEGISDQLYEEDANLQPLVRAIDSVEEEINELKEGLETLELEDSDDEEDEDEEADA